MTAFEYGHLKRGKIGKARFPPRADPQRRHKRQIYRLAQKIQQAQRGQHHRREDDAERGPGSLPARRQSRKLLLNDLKLGFDRGEFGARLIRLPQRQGVYI